MLMSFLRVILVLYINEFNGKEYLAVVKHYSKTLQDCLKITYSTFDEDYVQKINNFGVGFCLLNLKAMREDNIENKLLDFIEKNIDKLRYPEQEAFNYICHENVKYINLKYMMVPMWIRPDISNNEINQKYYSLYSRKDVLNAFFSSCTNTLCLLVKTLEQLSM